MNLWHVNMSNAVDLNLFLVNVAKDKPVFMIIDTNKTLITYIFDLNSWQSYKKLYLEVVSLVTIGGRS